MLRCLFLAWDTVDQSNKSKLKEARSRWALNQKSSLISVIRKKISCTREEAFDKIREWVNENKGDYTKSEAALAYEDKYKYTGYHEIWLKGWLNISKENNSRLKAALHYRYRSLEIDPPIDIIQTFFDYAPEMAKRTNYSDDALSQVEQHSLRKFLQLGLHSFLTKRIENIRSFGC